MAHLWSRPRLRITVIGVAVLLLTVMVPAQLRHGGGGGGWVMLGTSHVDGNNDHDKINCHGKDTYRSLKVRVTGSPVEFDRIIVEFGNHNRQTIPFRFAIASGSSRTTQLPGGARDLTSIEFYYRKASWASKPEVQLYGKP
jgi:hypothetical protein